MHWTFLFHSNCGRIVPASYIVVEASVSAVMSGKNWTFTTVEIGRKSSENVTFALSLSYTKIKSFPPMKAKFKIIAYHGKLSIYGMKI